jgi:Tfp pilus assembly protein PilX
MRTPLQRGSALLNAMIMMLAMSVLAVGIIRYAGRGAASAAAERNYAALVACAESGRQLLLTQLRQLQPDAQITFADRTIDNPAGGTVRVRSGHIGDAPGSVSVTRLELGSLGGNRGTTGNQSNMMGGAGDSSMARRDLKVIVHCQQPADADPTQGRQLEVELGVRLN